MSIIRLAGIFGKCSVEIEGKGALQNLPDVTILGIDTLDMNRLFLHSHHSFLLQISYACPSGNHSGEGIGYF